MEDGRGLIELAGAIQRIAQQVHRRDVFGFEPGGFTETRNGSWKIDCVIQRARFTPGIRGSRACFRNRTRLVPRNLLDLIGGRHDVARVEQRQRLLLLRIARGDDCLNGIANSGLGLDVET